MAACRRQPYNRTLPIECTAASFARRARMPDYHPLYLQGVAYFNECEYFEAHEVWEDLWGEEEGSDKKFYQGLIQAAVALHHFGNGNIRGAKKVNQSFRSYLKTYQPHHLGLDVEKFFADMDTCFAEIMASEEEFPEIEIDVDLIPEIHLDPPPE